MFSKGKSLSQNCSASHTEDRARCLGSSSVVHPRHSLKDLDVRSAAASTDLPSSAGCAGVRLQHGCAHHEWMNQPPNMFPQRWV